uniref:Uncharacterized protein n=1 Tax=Palisada sp. TaxID=1955416 RepID=A0A1Z1MSA4_9FLOR|nr:hypothetical protein [Palisada sp.]
MNFYIYTFHKFYPTFVLDINKLKKCKSLLSYINTVETQVGSISLGSLTRYFKYLTSQKIYINKLQIKNYELVLESRKIRCIWINKYLYSQLTLARSLWITIRTKTHQFGKLSLLPIGISVINEKMDIHRVTHEIYYGYCKKIELLTQNTKSTFGRKCTLYYKNRYYITIQEFFHI